MPKRHSTADMQNAYPGHPTDDELERFVLHRSQEQELEAVESHILACESCVTRLEDLETEITVIKLALRKLQAEQLAKQTATAKNTWKAWLTVPKLSVASGVAAAALAIIAVPVLLERSAPAVQVSLATYRGSETSVVPGGRRLHVDLNARGLSEVSVDVMLVDLRGIEVWKGRGLIHNERVELNVPPITERGAHFLRLYEPGHATSDAGLLREFAFQVK